MDAFGGPQVARFLLRLRDSLLAAGPGMAALLLQTGGTPGPRVGVPARQAGGIDIDDLYQTHAAAMYRMAVAVVRDPALAEDVVQEAIVKAWRAYGGFRGDSSVRTWLLRITHNSAVSMIRLRREVATDPAFLDPGSVDAVAGTAVASVFQDAFEDAVFRLDETSRAILALRELDGLAYEEIAEVLGVTPGVVKTRLFRARQRLAVMLEGWAP